MSPDETVVGGAKAWWLRAIVAVILIGAASGVGLRVLEADHDGAGLPDPRTPGDSLLMGGAQVTLEEAAASVGFPLIRPQSPLASDEVLSEVWVATGEQPTVALAYESGVRACLTVWPPGNPLSPADFYAQHVAATGAGWTQEINGTVAWVCPADAQAPGFPPEAVVNLVVGGIEISLHGPTIPVEELVTIAESVQQPAPN